MARYGLFVLKVPLNPNQPRNMPLHDVGYHAEFDRCWSNDTSFPRVPLKVIQIDTDRSSTITIFKLPPISTETHHFRGMFF